MKGFILTPAAKQDLNEVWEYIANDNIEAADRVLDALERRWLGWRRTPASGTGARNLVANNIVSFWFILT